MATVRMDLPVDTRRRELLLGNEAIARGAYEAGVEVATGYPGTPSTEIMEALARYPEIQATWCPNEKVALEVAIGASLGEARALVTMKHVGLNVAADPFFTLSYMGVRGGLVVVSADDPGMFSSQNEQDNRHYAKAAKVPLLEPADAAECARFTRLAFELSERFETPVLLRTTTRIAHSRGLVELGEREARERAPKPFRREPERFVMLPAYARRRHPWVEARLKALAEYNETSPFNQVIWGDRSLGIVASGVAYLYAREVFPWASFLKLGMTYPLPRKLIQSFADQVETLLVVEELDPFLEEQIRVWIRHPRILGKLDEEIFPVVGELRPEIVAGRARLHGLLAGHEAEAAGMEEQDPLDEFVAGLLPRPPILCPGCPHRAPYDILRRLRLPDREGKRQMKVVISGDVGCYTLAALPPLRAMDTQGAMGSSIGFAMGMEMAGVPNRVVATLGDSTFFHSGLPLLVNAVYNRHNVTVVVLDNGATAMTGQHASPASGWTLKGDISPVVDIEQVCRGIGVKHVKVVGAYDEAEIEAAIREAALREDGPSVVIVRDACALLPPGKANRKEPSRFTYRVDPEACTGCKACLTIACPPIQWDEDKQVAWILEDLCDDCDVCAQVCPHDAIHRVERER